MGNFWKSSFHSLIHNHNAYSILSKIDDLRAECSAASPDIVLIAESFCRADITDAYLAVPGYQIVVRRDGRDTAGGRGRGLLIYVREGVTAAELHLEGGDQVTECSGISSVSYTHLTLPTILLV